MITMLPRIGKTADRNYEYFNQVIRYRSGQWVDQHLRGEEVLAPFHFGGDYSSGGVVTGPGRQGRREVG